MQATAHPPSGVVRLSDLTLERTGDGQRLGARIDGEPVEMVFPDDLAIEPRAEAFLTVALLEAMARGEPLVVDDTITISPRIAASLDRVQQVLTTWNSDDLRKVPVQVRTAAPGPSSGLVVCAFSGGIDSSYTYARHADAITHLLLFQGFDGQGDEETWRRNVAARRAFADSQGKRLIAVRSNLRAYCAGRRIAWLLVHGSLLGALGTVVGAERMLVPASFTYNDLFPWGSHPLLDPLWSSERCTVEHDGNEASRVAKTRYIAQWPGLLAQLQVCWRGVDRNCGACPKCVRTSFALHLLGTSSPAIPAYSGRALLPFLKPGNEASLAFTDELIGLCLDHHALAEARQLKSYRRTYLVKYHLTELAKVLLGPALRRFVRRVRPQAWHATRVKMRGSNERLL